MAITLKFFAWLTALSVYEHASYSEQLQFWKIYISISAAVIALVLLGLYMIKKNVFIGVSIFISISILFVAGPPLAIIFHVIPPLWIVPYSIIVIYSVSAAIWREIARRTGKSIVTRSILRVDSLFRMFWAVFPIAIAIAFVFGVVTAISGNADISPYAASIGFFSYVVFYVFRLLRKKEQ